MAVFVSRNESSDRLLVQSYPLNERWTKSVTLTSILSLEGVQVRFLLPVGEKARMRGRTARVETTSARLLFPTKHPRLVPEVLTGTISSRWYSSTGTVAA